MKTSLLKNVFICILLLISISTSLAQNAVLSNNASISVMTCGTGNEIYSLFGHTAIRVRDVQNDLDVVYNYGAFDFDTPNFVLQFTKGNLDYFITNNRYVDFISQYNYEKRDVYEQELNISLELKQELFDNLSQSMLSDERLYQYKFIDNNCTSKVVDVINKTLKRNVIIKKVDTDQSYRSILFPYFDNHFYEKLGTSILFGTKVDQMGTKIFLPLELQKNLALIQFQNQPLSKENKMILNFKEQSPISWWNNIYTYIFLFGFIILLNNKRLNYTYLTIIGLLGVLFTFLGFYSSHQELGYNYNILLFNPALLLLSYFVVTKKTNWIYTLAVANIVMMLVYFCFMITKIHLLIISPILITNLLILIRLAIKNKNAL